MRKLKNLIVVILFATFCSTGCKHEHHVVHQEQQHNDVNKQPKYKHAPQPIA